MPHISITVSDQALIESVKSKGKYAFDALVDKMGSMMVDLQRKAQSYAPVGLSDGTHLAGTLRDSIRDPKVQVDGSEILGSVTYGGDPTTVETYGGEEYDYFRIITEGSTEHRVPVSEGKRALHFLLEGKDVFSKYAVVSGVEPNPFMAEALYDMRSELISGIEETLYGVFGGEYFGA